MKYATPALISFLNSGGVFLMADCYTVTLQSGPVYRWTTSDVPLTLGGNAFTPATDNGSAPLIKRGAIRCARGTEVQTLDLTLLNGQSAQLMGVNLGLAAHNGAFDAARIRVERVFSATPGDTSMGSVVLFEGNCAGVDPSSTQVVLHVKSDLELLQNQFPRILFQAGCANCFGDAGCTLNVASYTTAGTVGSTPAPTASAIASTINGGSGSPTGGAVTGINGLNLPSVPYTATNPTFLFVFAGDGAGAGASVSWGQVGGPYGTRQPTLNITPGSGYTYAKVTVTITNNGNVAGYPPGVSTQTYACSVSAVSNVPSYSMGVLVMTGGAASGARRTVSATSGTVISLAVPLPQAPAVGDTFSIYYGCNRTAAACAGFGNLNNYQGFPYVPESSTAI